MYISGTQQADRGYFPQQTSSVVQNDSGYKSFTTQMNNDPYYPQLQGNQQHHLPANHPYYNSGLSNTQYPGPQQPQMMSMQNNSQFGRQQATFQSQNDGRNASFQDNGRPMAPVHNHHINNGNFQQQFKQPQQFLRPQQMNNNQYSYKQHHLSNQVSSYTGQRSYMPTGKN